MKNYAIEEEAFTFIKTYEIKQDRIYLHLASRKKHRPLKNTEKNRKKINEKMDFQVKESHRFIEYTSLVRFLTKISLILGVLMGINIFTIILLLIDVPFLIYTSLIKRDIKKNKKFLENRKELNNEGQKKLLFF